MANRLLRTAVAMAMVHAAAACAARQAALSPRPFPGAAATAAAAASPDPGESIASSALALLGTAYRFGGTTPQAGFDCSGLVAYVLAEHGIAAPRTTAAQYGAGRPVERRDVRAGDLVFFSTTGDGATHVGIVSDPAAGEFVHAPADGSRVRIDRLEGDYWRRRWMGARRLY
jgi:cell wall-associated NlpC family hydrolase